MRKVFLLQDLCCANCAAKIEKKVAALDGVDSASVNFLTSKLIVEAQQGALPTLPELVRKIVRKVEPDVAVREIG